MSKFKNEIRTLKHSLIFGTKKQLNLEDETSWKKEQKVESVIEGLSELEKAEDGKAVAIGLKLLQNKIK